MPPGDKPPLRRLQGTFPNCRRCFFSPVPRGTRVTILCSATLPQEAMESFGTGRDQRDCRVPPARPCGAAPSALGTFCGSLAASRCWEDGRVFREPAELSGTRFPEFRTPGLPTGRFSETDCWKARTNCWWLPDGERRQLCAPHPGDPAQGHRLNAAVPVGQSFVMLLFRSAHLRMGKERASPCLTQACPRLREKETCDKREAVAAPRPSTWASTARVANALGSVFACPSGIA